MLRNVIFLFALWTCFLASNAEQLRNGRTFEIPRELQVEEDPLDNITDAPTFGNITDAPTFDNNTDAPTFSPTISPTNTPTQNPTEAFVVEDEPINFAIVAGAAGGVFCICVVLGGVFIFILLGRRENRVRAGKKKVDEHLLQSMAILDEKKREVEESRRKLQKAKASKKMTLDLDQEAGVTDLRSTTKNPPAPESVISTASSQPPPGMYGSPKPNVRLSELSVSSTPKDIILPHARESAVSDMAGIPRLSSGDVTALPRVMSKSLEKQKVTAALKEKQGSSETKADKKPSLKDDDL